MISTLLSPFIAAANKKNSTDAGNVFSGFGGLDNAQRAQDSLKDLLSYQGNAAANDPIQSSVIATREVQNNPILAQLFAQNGTLDRTTAEEQSLASRGWQLQPEDYEAYGQGSGAIARAFDSAEGNLAQSLANRGLSTSGVAGKSFMTSQGNKLEMLGNLQRQIADNRMQMNLQRLGQTRNFLSSLGGQAQNAIQQQYGRQLASEQNAFEESATKANLGQSFLKNMQNQSNEQLMQRQQTGELPGWARVLGGIDQGMGTDIGRAASLISAARGSGPGTQQPNNGRIS